MVTLLRASYSYSTNRSRLASLNFVKGTQNLFSLNYFYQNDPTNCPSGTSADDGLIQCISDGVDSGRTVNYTYDSLKRVTTAVTNGSAGYAKWGLSETSDRYNNRWSQAVTAGAGPSSSLSFANPGGAQTNHPDGWCFDPSGNLLFKTTSTCPPSSPNFVYDGEDRMVGDPTAGAAYVYDGNGTRVQKCLPNCASPTSSTVYIFSESQDIAEYDNGAAPSSPAREFVFLDSVPGSGLLATIRGGSTPTTTYFHSDHLSWRASTDGTPNSPTFGQMNGQQGTYPFGESWYSSNGTEFTFTTYQRDSESGLDYAAARYYDSSAGRFCSADPLAGQLDDPQTWNRYTYVRNNPVNLTDPSGQGFLSFLFGALAIAADVLTGGATTPELAAQLGAQQGFGLLAAVTQIGNETKPQGLQRPPLPPPIAPLPAPPGYTRCPKAVMFLITGVGPDDAKGPGSTGTPPSNGDVAFNPKNFGLTDAQGRRIADSDRPILFKPDWGSAQIPNGKNGTGTMKPAPGKGFPTVPNGLPVGQDDTLPGTDTIGGKGINRAKNENRIDLYRYSNQVDALAAKRRVPTIVYIPNGSGAKCSH